MLVSTYILQCVGEYRAVHIDPVTLGSVLSWYARGLGTLVEVPCKNKAHEKDLDEIVFMNIDYP